MYRLKFSGTSSSLTTHFFPPLYLRENSVIGLSHFSTFNSIPNFDDSNNKFYIGEQVIEIPTGAYEIESLHLYLESKLKEIHEDATLQITPNINTLQVEIYSTHDIFFDKPNTIASVLGFEDIILAAKTKHKSSLPVNILKVNTINVNCDICSNSFQNNRSGHILYDFVLDTAVGYKIVKEPQPISYLPVSVKEINSITLDIVDENNKLINFRGENIDIGLYLKPFNA